MYGVLTKEEVERYSRQIVMKHIGTEGQKKLKEARVCVVGVGGLGSYSSMQLAAMGFGHLRIVDRDVVDLTNLQRQPLYDGASIGYPKVEAAMKRLRALNPHVEIESLTASVDFESAEKVVRGMDVVVDGLDRFAPRYAINRACVRLKVPYIFGGALETYGNVSSIIPEKTACLECFMGKMKDERLPTCETVGVIPPTVSVIASIQVKETLDIVLGLTPSLAGRLLFCDLNNMTFDVFNVVRKASCQACGSVSPEATASEVPASGAPRVAELCGKNAFSITPGKTLSLDIPKLALALRERYKLNMTTQFGVTLAYSDGVSVSLLKGGNALIKGATGRKEALRIYDELMSLASEAQSF